MPQPLPAPAVILCALAPLLESCEGESPPSRPALTASAEPAAAAASPALRSPGRVTGTVLFRGAIPPQTMYIAEAGDVEAHAPIVDVATRGLKDAVVWLEPLAGDVAPPLAPRPAPQLVDQVNFTFVPHVIAVRSGEEVSFTNSDNANHNVHCRSTRRRRWPRCSTACCR